MVINPIRLTIVPPYRRRRSTFSGVTCEHSRGRRHCPWGAETRLSCGGEFVFVDAARRAGRAASPPFSHHSPSACTSENADQSCPTNCCPGARRALLVALPEFVLSLLVKSVLCWSLAGIGFGQRPDLDGATGLDGWKSASEVAHGVRVAALE